MMKIPLIKITFALTLLGIFFLLFISTFPPQKVTNISDITSKDIGKKVKIHGQVMIQEDIEESKLLVIKIKDSTGEIEGIISYSNNALQLTKNLTIIGKVQQYKGSLQIQVEKIMN